MTGFLDIAPATIKVVVGESTFDVGGVSAAGVAVLLARFPEARALIAQRPQEITPERMFALVPEAIAAIIAAGVGSPGDEAFEAKAATLPIETQIDFVEAIFTATFPKGVGPFVERLSKLAAQRELLGGSLVPETPGTTSQGPSST